MARFNISRDRSGDAWFRIGTFDVTSSALLALLGGVGMVLCVFVPAMLGALAFSPVSVFAGEVWRLVTWPFVDRIGLWSALSLLILWWFGSDLERQVGRRRMMWLYVGMWATLTVVALVLGLVIAPTAVLVGLGMIQLLVLLLWIAENPRRPFFFNIPAWVIGVFFVALQVLSSIAARDYIGLLSLVVSLAVVAVLARRAGLLSDLAWLPGAARPRAAASAPSRAERRRAERTASDAQRMDELLDKINASGIHSLSRAERKELDALRERRRKGR